MTMDPIDPNLPPNHPIEPNVRQPVPESRGMGSGIPLVIAAFALIFGLMFYNFSSDRTTTASVDAPRTMTQTDPSTPPAPPTTPPVKTQ
jgi:hypothetical protein